MLLGGVRPQTWPSMAGGETIAFMGDSITQAVGIKVMILTSTMIGEDQSKELNQILIPLYYGNA